MKLTSIAVLVLSLSPAALMAQGNNHVVGKNGHSIMLLSQDEIAQAKQFWTEDRLNNAIPDEEFDESDAKVTKKDRKAAAVNAPKILAKPILANKASVKPAKSGVPEEADVNKIPFSHAGKLRYEKKTARRIVAPHNLLAN